MGILSSLVNGAVQLGINDKNIKAQEITNLQNLRLSVAQMKLNKQMADDANNLQKLMADEAYQRSTPAQQIANLIQAGYSPQQAKQIVAGGSASPASMPMGSSVAPTADMAEMVAPQAQAPQVDLASPAASTLLGQLALDLASPSGGAFGEMRFAKLRELLVDLQTTSSLKIPASASLSLSDFDAWLNEVANYVPSDTPNSSSWDAENMSGEMTVYADKYSLEQVEAAKKILGSREYKLVKRSSFGSRALSNYLNTTVFESQTRENQLYMEQYARAVQYYAAEMAGIQFSHDELQISIENINNQYFRDYLQTPMLENDLNMAKTALSKSREELSAWSNPAVREIYRKSIISDVHVQQLVSAVTESQMQWTNEVIESSPAMRNIFNMCKALESYGILDIVDGVCKINDSVNKWFPVGKVAEAAGDVVQTITRQVLDKKGRTHTLTETRKTSRASTQSQSPLQDVLSDGSPMPDLPL